MTGKETRSGWRLRSIAIDRIIHLVSRVPPHSPIPLSVHHLSSTYGYDFGHSGSLASLGIGSFRFTLL